MIGSCAGTKVTLAPVRFSNSERTALKFFCSAPVHTAATSRLAPFSFGRVTVPAVSEGLLDLPLSLLLSLPPQAASESVSAPAATTAAVRTVVRVR